MRIVKTIILATALTAGGSAAFAQGRSSEVDQAQGIRQSALAFADQMQSGGFFGGTSAGARAEEERMTRQSLANRSRPGSISDRQWLNQEAYRERLADWAGRIRR